MTSNGEVSTNLRQISRYITTHDENGLAIISDALSNLAPVRDDQNGDLRLSLLYTNKLKPDLSDGTDIAKYAGHIQSPPGLTIAEGTVCRFCDFAPGSLTPMHRTLSLDYGVVLEGEMELVLDSGETQHLRRGDVVVQRGSNHAWRNVTPDEMVEGRLVQKWARMFYVLQAAEPVRLNSGTILSEHHGGIDTVYRKEI